MKDNDRNERKKSKYSVPEHTFKNDAEASVAAIKFLFIINNTIKKDKHVILRQ